MKKSMTISITAAALFFFIACGNIDTVDKKPNNHINHDTSKIVQTDKPAISSSFSLKDESIHALFQHYILLTSALINGDIAEAKIAANTIEAGANEIKGLRSIATTASRITTAADIETQRTYYAALSNSFIDLIKQSGFSAGELYVDYCPMALNNKGANWLSTYKEIRNPYFGEKMMTCGEVKETIK